MEPDNKTDDIPPLSDNYHKARRQYALFAALLLAWELIGLRLDSKFFADRGLTVLSPQAIPIVLIVLLAYFAYRTTIEWHQSDARRRALRVSKLDFRIAHLLAVIALGVFVVQRILDIQLANKLAEEDWYLMLLGVSVGGLVALTYKMLITQKRPRLLRLRFLVQSVIVLVSLVFFVYHSVAAYLASEHMRMVLALGGFVAGIILYGTIFWLDRRIRIGTMDRAVGESPDPPTGVSE